MNQVQVINPSDFFSNSGEYQRMKESNDSIFSFGTSRQSFGKNEISPDLKYRSVSQNEENRVNKEINIKEIEDFNIEIEQNDENDESQSNKN